MVTLKEITKGLTPTQKKAFLKLLESGKPSNSYNLGVRITTMHALERKGLVKGRWRGTPVMAEINYEWQSVYRKVN